MTPILPPHSTEVVDTKGRFSKVWYLFLNSLAGTSTANAPLVLSFAGGAGSIGASYSGSLNATGGVQPYTYSISSGSLPAGLSLNAATGVITGTPTTAGSTTFTAEVTDNVGSTKTLSCSIAISGPVTPAPSLSALTVAEVGSRQQIPPGGNTYTTIRVTPTLGGSGAGIVTLWFSFDGGSNWYWQQSYAYSAVTTYWDIQVIILLGAGTNNFIARGIPGNYEGGPGAISTATLNSQTSSGTTASNSLTITLGAPTATGATLSITNVAGSAPTQTNIYQGLNPIGTPIAQVLFSIVTPGASDTAPYFYDWWVEWVDGSLNPVNPGGVANTSGWNHYWETPNDGQTHKNNLVINYPLIDAYLLIRVWGRSRNSTVDNPPFTGDAGAVLQQWPSTNTYYLLHVGLPPGGANQGTSQNINQGASLLSDPGGEFAVVGMVVTSGTFTGPGFTGKWATTYSSGSIEVRNDGGSSGANYYRLTGPSTGIFQNASVQPGLPVYAQMWVRSNNPGGSPSVTLSLLWLDKTGSSISTSTIGSATGFISAWTLGPTGYAVAPANAASVNVYVQNSGAEPGGGYWDVDDIWLQPVINQQAASQTNTTNPANTGFGGQGSFRALSTSTTQKSNYGLDSAVITSSDGGSASVEAMPGAYGFFSADSGSARANLVAGANSGSTPAELLITNDSGVTTILRGDGLFEYKGKNCAGLGTEPILYHNSGSNDSASHTNVNMTVNAGVPPAGTYYVQIIAQTHTAATGSVAFTLTWNGGTFSSTFLVFANLDLTNGSAWQNWVLAVIADGVHNITYSLTVSGGATGTYDWDATLLGVTY